MVLNIFLFLMLVFAFLSVQTKLMRNAVIYLGVFSLASSVVYFLYQAPDVGLAEAIIGSTLTTVLYLVALKKYRVITVYLIDQSKTGPDRQLHLQRSGSQPDSQINIPAIREIENFCRSKEYEMHVIQTTESLSELYSHAANDVIVVRGSETCHVYANLKNYIYNDLDKHISCMDVDQIQPGPDCDRIARKGMSD